MKRLYVFIICLVLILGVGGVFIYKFWYLEKQITVWDLIPESAIVVYESTNTVQNWNQIQSKAVWTNLEQIPFYASIGNRVEVLDSLSGRQGRLDKLLQAKPFVFSIHRISQEALDALFFIRLQDLGDYNVMNKLVEEFKSRDDYQFQTRSYHDFSINEAVNKEYDEVFSYLIHKDYFVGSFTPFLVEDVIRKLAGQTQGGFNLENPKLSEVAKLENDQGNLYIDNRKLPQLLSVFARENLAQELTSLKDLAQSTFLDVKFTDDKVLFNGFTVLGGTENQYLGSVTGAQGYPLDFEQLISDKVAVLYHLTFQDPRSWHSKLQAYWKTHQKQQVARWTHLKESFDWDPQALINAQRHELGLAIVETIDEEPPARLIYLKFGDFNEGLLQLNRIAEKAASNSEDSLYVESFGGRDIRQINVSEFPSCLWGDLFHGFEQSFFMPFENYIVIGSSIQSLKDLVRSIEAEETWGKSISKSQFLESTLQEANLSMFVDLDNTWNLLEQNLSPSWKSYLDLHAKALKGFDLLAIQFSDIGDKFYTSGVLKYGRSGTAEPQVRRFLTIQQAFTKKSITTRPFVVRNHNNGSREVLVQDSLNNLYLISNQGKVLWEDSLPGSIRGEVSQIDFYRNGKLQYLLATEKAIHIIDRNGNLIEGYPIAVATATDLRNVSAIDYDNTKRYRIMASNENGHIYMFDKAGKILEGWNPKVMQDQLLFAPQHIRVRGKDCIIALLENGMVHIMNRRGDPYPGFPVDLKGPTQSPLLLEEGTDFSKTFFSTITKDGLIVKFNLLGAILQKNQLVKPSKDTQYTLCLDPVRRNYVISRQNANRLGLLDRKGNIILEKDYLTSGTLTVQYYPFGNDHSIFAVTDPVQQFTYFYDQDGILINSAPIESSNEIALLYFEGQKNHHAYSVYDQKFTIHSF